MNHALLFIGGLLVAMLSALFAVPHFVDWNGYRGVFEEEASRVIGREVRVGGAVNVRLLPTPYVRFEKVRVADATGGTGEPFFRADAFTMWLSVPPLLRGVLEANEIELKRPKLKLAADAEGRGNWSSLDLSPGSLPFVPAGVTLQAVRIIDGSIGFAGAAGGGELELSGLAGEFEAEALEGPYKFKGTTSWRGAERQIRISTARPDADGGVRLKAAIIAPQAGNTYVLDGRLSDLGGRARLDGEIQSKVRLDSLSSPVAGPASTSAAKDDGQKPFVDLRAAVASDLTAARLGQIVLSVENVGQPQLVTGDARMAWTQEPAIELSLSSRWLDLDRLAGRTPGDQPIDTAQALVSALLGQLPGKGRVDARIEVDQTSLGGEAVSGLSLKLVREAGPLAIRELRAGLPGGARLDISGTLVEGAGGPELDGVLSVRGSSLSRFLVWAGKTRSLIEGRTDGPFLVRGKLRLGETAVALSDVAAELQGMPLTGDVRYETKDRRRVALRLDGQTVDVAQLWPGAVEWLALTAPAAARDATAGPADVPAAARFDAASTDLALRVRVAELVAGPRTLRDVDADIAIEKGRLTIPRLRLVTTDGLALDVEGEITGITDKPKGTLRGLVAADRPAAVEGLLRALGDGTAADATEAQIAALAPLRLAGRIALGQRTPTATDIDADGTVQGGRFVAKARLDAGWQGWRDGVSEITVSADSPDVDNLVRIALAAGADAKSGRPPRRGQLSFKAQGIPGQGMLASATIEAQGLVLAYDGPLKLQKGVPTAIDGEVRITADEAADALDLAGIPLGGAVSGIPIDGVLAVTARDNVLTVKPRELQLGARRIGGHLIVAQRSGKPSSVTADIDVGEVTLAELLTPVLERRSQAVDQALAMAGDVGGGGAWPELSFDLSPLDRIEGKVEVRFTGLKLKDGVGLGGGRLQAKLAAGRLEVEALESATLGGRASATLTLVKVRGGVDGKINLRFTGLKPGAGPGTLALSLDLDGRGQSPRSLIEALKGGGRLQVAGGLDIPGLTPASVAALSEAFVGGRIEPGEGSLTRALEAAMAAATVTVPPGTYVVQAADGAVRIKEIVLASQAGRSVVDTTLSLSELRLDSEWRIEQAPAVAPRSPGGAAARSVQVPPVYVVYAGSLDALRGQLPKVSGGALERELSVRKMERDVEELERLRKEDENRRRAEEERLRQLEAERARAAMDPAVAMPPAVTPPAVAPPAAVPHSQVPPQAAQPGVPPPAGDAASPVVVAPAAPAQPNATSVRPPPPRPVRRVSPGEEILRQLSPN